MNQRVDRCVRCCAILAILIIVALTVYRVGTMGRTQANGGFTVGEQFESKEFVLPVKSTLMIFARSTCQACEAARPVMKTLVEAVYARKDGTRVQLMSVLGEAESEKRMAAEIGLRPFDLGNYANKKETKLRTLPTFVVADSTARILYVHEGTPDAVDLQAIRRVLDR